MNAINGVISAKHKIAIIALHGSLPFEVAMACDVFDWARTPVNPTPYSVMVCGEARVVKSEHFDLQIQWDLSHVAGADTVIVPGIRNPTMAIPDAVIDAVQQAAASGTRVASICTGAFVLAAAGLLNGKRATTHWRAAGELARCYPQIRVDPNVLFVDNGQILTSAGAMAGIDLCLHIVRRDFGAAVAADCARAAVMPPEREGGQAQYIIHAPPQSTSTLAPVLDWISSNLGQPMTLQTLAAKAGLSERTFSRRFREQTGTTPLQWILIARVRHAQSLLETTRLSIEQIASEAGFDAAAALRIHFSRTVGVSPAAYRKTFGGQSAHVALTLH